MAPAPSAPKQGRYPIGGSTASKTETHQSLLPSSDKDTEMGDARGKNILHHSRSNSAEGDNTPESQPPKKKISPNHCGQISLPSQTTGVNHQTLSTLPSPDTVLRLPLRPTHPLRIATWLAVLPMDPRRWT
jgi:hypothetical protein